MSVEATEMLGKLSGRDLLMTILHDSRLAESPKHPLRVKVWGRQGINSPYNIVPRREVISDFLQNGVKLRPEEIHKTQVHVICEKPWNIPHDEELNILPKDEGRRSYTSSEYGWYNGDDTTGEHFLVIAAYRIWEGLKSDRELLSDWNKRKRKTDAGWIKLGQKMRHVELRDELRSSIERNQTAEELEVILAEELSRSGKLITVNYAIHEISHLEKERKRKAEGIHFTKSRIQKRNDREEEQYANRIADELDKRWDYMFDFRAHPRKLRTK